MMKIKTLLCITFSIFISSSNVMGDIGPEQKARYQSNE